MTKLLWSKTRPDAVIPVKRDEDAGWDLYPCFEGPYLEIEADETVFIGLGVASAFPKEYVMFLKERGSTAKYGLSIRSGVIDSGYRGEYVLALTNINDEGEPIYIVKDDFYDGKSFLMVEGGPILKPNNTYPASKAICQAVLLPVPQVESQEIPYEELLKIESERGTGKMGSSGK